MAHQHTRTGSRSPGTGHPDGRAAGTQTTSRRSFTRYGYGDYASTNRPFRLLHRVWPGTQRFLLWGDPVLAAGYSRHANFAGALGLEWFEPLSFFGKKDSAAVGSPGPPRRTRDLYREGASEAAPEDWKKYRYTYRILGRTSYDPAVEVHDLTRPLRAAFGPAASAVERALGAASRILPLITVAHAPSTACNVYWPEMPTPVPLVAGCGRGSGEHRLSSHGWPSNSDFDMTPPYSFGNVSPLDPELIYGVDDFVADLASGKRRGKHTPLEIADRLDELATVALDTVTLAPGQQVVDGTLLAQMVVDIRIQANLGRHFAALTRAAVAFGLATRGLTNADRVLDHYRSAITIWDELVADALPYAVDLPFGQTPYSRGTWADRKPAMLADLAAVQTALADPVEPATQGVDPFALRPSKLPEVWHRPPSHCVSGQPLPLSLRTDDDRVIAVRVRFRPVNQARDYQVADLERCGTEFHGRIPAEAVEDDYPVQYFFEICADDDAWPYPGLHADLANQPYFVVHHDERTTWGRHDLEPEPAPLR